MMANVIGQLGLCLLHFVWQGALIAGVAGIGLAALRNSRPQARYALACAALFACLAWPAFDLALRLQAPLPAASADGMNALHAPAIAMQAGLPLDWLHSHLDIIVLAWAACACALSLRMALGLWWIGRAARRERCNAEWQARIALMAERIGLKRQVRLRIVDGIASPLTAGWWRPVVLLPSSLLTGMPADLLEALIAHELGHIKRADYLVNLVQNAVETLLFYHPAVWWLSHRIRVEREQIADDLAAEQVGERRLALALSELEKRQFAPASMTLAGNGGDLMQRIRRLLRPTPERLSWKVALPVLGLAAALAAGSANVTATAVQAVATTAATAVDTTVPAEPVRQKALAQFSSCAKPVWPRQSLRDETTGTVTLAFLIDTEGNVVDSRIDKSSGYHLLDEAARSGIAKCHFRPATENGVAVQAWAPLQYVWTLK